MRLYSTEALIPTGKLGEGNSASISKGRRMLDFSRDICWFVLHVFGPFWNVEFPLFLFFLYHRVSACKTATHNIKSCFCLLEECLSCTKQENTRKVHLFFLSETVGPLNTLSLTTSAVCWKHSGGVWESWDVFQAYAVLYVVFVHGPMASSVWSQWKVRDGEGECVCVWGMANNALMCCWDLLYVFASWSLVRLYSRCMLFWNCITQISFGGSVSPDIWAVHSLLLDKRKYTVVSQQ